MKKKKINYKSLADVLLCFTLYRFSSVTLGKISAVRLKYGIILEAMRDLHLKNKENKESAIKYFNSPLFEKHCQEVSISKELMLRIVNNPESINAIIGKFHQDEIVI